MNAPENLFDMYLTDADGEVHNWGDLLAQVAQLAAQRGLRLEITDNLDDPGAGPLIRLTDEPA